MEARNGVGRQEDEDLIKEEIRGALKKMKNKKAKSIDESVGICGRYVMERHGRVIKFENKVKGLETEYHCAII